MEIKKSRDVDKNWRYELKSKFFWKEKNGKIK